MKILINIAIKLVLAFDLATKGSKHAAGVLTRPRQQIKGPLLKWLVRFSHSFYYAHVNQKLIIKKTRQAPRGVYLYFASSLDPEVV